MTKFEIYEDCGKFGVRNGDIKVIPAIYDSVKFYDDFIKVGNLGFYQLYDSVGFLVFSDMYEEIFVYSKHIACKQEYGDWIIFDKSALFINMEYYQDIYCDEKYLAVKENSCWKVFDQVK